MAHFRIERQGARRMPATKRSFPAEPASLRHVRRFIRERAAEARLYRGDTEDLVQAVSEICANAVQHSEGDRFTISWNADPGRMTEVKVLDQGIFGCRGMAYGKDAGGLGIPLAVALVDEVAIAKGTDSKPGTTVRLVKRLDAESA